MDLLAEAEFTRGGAFVCAQPPRRRSRAESITADLERGEWTTAKLSVAVLLGYVVFFFLVWVARWGQG